MKSFTYFYLHLMGNTFSFRENFRHGFGTQDISQRSRGQQLGGSKGVVDITHWHDRVKYSVVHDGIHCYRHRIFGQNLKWKYNCLKFCNRGEVTWCDFHQICIQLFQVLKMESFGFHSDKKKYDFKKISIQERFFIHAFFFRFNSQKKWLKLTVHTKCKSGWNITSTIHCNVRTDLFSYTNNITVSFPYKASFQIFSKQRTFL